MPCTAPHCRTIYSTCQTPPGGLAPRRGSCTRPRQLCLPRTAGGTARRNAAAARSTNPDVLGPGTWPGPVRLQQTCRPHVGERGLALWLDYLNTPWRQRWHAWSWNRSLAAPQRDSLAVGLRPVGWRASRGG